MQIIVIIKRIIAEGENAKYCYYKSLLFSFSPTRSNIEEICHYKEIHTNRWTLLYVRNGCTEINMENKLQDMTDKSEKDATVNARF